MAVQNMWQGKRNFDNVRLCIICTNVAESGITIPDIGRGLSLALGFIIMSPWMSGKG